ncbi:MAG TPA: hypothetical protein VJB93_00685 [Patescibacteria group bacterium]|nr:hypothetical protein [Patescibacteria group bacterium]
MDTPSLIHHKQVIPVGMLFKTAYQRMKSRAKALFAIAGIYGLAIILFGIFMKTQENSVSVTLALITVLVFIIYTVVVLWSATALVDATIREDTAPFSSVAINGFKYFFPLLGINIVSVLIALGGYVAFIIPGIAIGIQLAFAAAIYIHKKISIMESIRLSRLLVKGRWWAVFGRFILLMLVIYAILLILILLMWLITSLIGESSGSEITSMIVLGLFAVLYLPYSLCFIAELYHDLDKTNPLATEQQIKKNKTFLTVFMIIGIVGIPLIITMSIIISILSINNLRKSGTDDIPASWQNDDSNTSTSPENATLEGADIPLDEPTTLDEADIEALLQQYQEQGATAD